MKTIIDVILLVAGSLVFLQVQTVGTLFGTELAFLILLPAFAVVKRRAFREKKFLWFLAIGSAWLSAQIITDILRDIPFADFSRGWAKISFLMINTVVLFLAIYARPLRLVMFACAVAIGQILTYLTNPSLTALENPWKFGIGFPLTMILIAGVAFFRGSNFSILGTTIIFCTGLLHIALGFRSHGLVCLATAVFLLAAKQFENRAIKSSRFWVTCVSVGIVLLAALQGYQTAAVTGWLGLSEQNKAESQTGGEFGIFLGGRGEMLASLPAIADSPIWGHGSWAKDPVYTLLMLEGLRELGYDAYVAGDGETIPSHSFLLGSWVEAGVMGAMAWFWIAVLSIAVLREALRQRIEFMPFVVYTVFLQVWNILYSPFGAEHRIIAAFFIAITLLVHSGKLGIVSPSEGYRRVNAFSGADRRLGVRPLGGSEAV